MKKTGYEIVEMIAKGKAPKKIYLICDEAEWELVDRIHYCYQKAADDIYDLDIMEHLNDEFEIVEEKKVWKPKYNEEYWFINNSLGKVRKDKWENTFVDEIRYDLGNIFKTKEEAEKALEKIKIYTQLKRFAEEHNTENIDWNDKLQAKNYIIYEWNALYIYTDFSIKRMNQVYFSSKEIAEQAIKEIGEDNIKKLFEE